MEALFNWIHKCSTTDARERTRALFAADEPTATIEINTDLDSLSHTRSGLRKLIAEAGLNISPLLFICCCITLSFIALMATSKVFSPYFTPLAALGAAWLPVSYLNYLAEKRATGFLVDYSPLLLASASSMKAGLTAYLALERAGKLLSPKSLVRQEIESLLANVSNGIPKEEAIAKMAADIRLPELELFRSALLLVTSHGGKFVPTLHRLALVSRERANLISAARVSTASMRMTGNILLGITPILIIIISLRTNDFWEIILHHPTASACGSLGITIIVTCYLILRRMSNFKP